MTTNIIVSITRNKNHECMNQHIKYLSMQLKTFDSDKKRNIILIHMFNIQLYLMLISIMIWIMVQLMTMMNLRLNLKYCDSITRGHYTCNVKNKQKVVRCVIAARVSKEQVGEHSS